jgi:hypothetical protein
MSNLNNLCQHKMFLSVKNKTGYGNSVAGEELLERASIDLGAANRRGYVKQKATDMGTSVAEESE